MTTLNHTAATPYDGQSGTVTVTGLPKQAAQAVADYTDQLTHKLEARRLTRKVSRRQAYRIVEKRSRPRPGVLSEERRLELARQGEKAARPAEAEIRIAEPTAGGGAYLRLYDGEGGCQERHLWNLTEHPAAGRHVPYAPVTEPTAQGAMTRALLDAADERIAGVGFVRPCGATWQPWSRSSAFFTSQRAPPACPRAGHTDGRLPRLRGSLLRARAAASPTGRRMDRPAQAARPVDRAQEPRRVLGPHLEADPERCTVFAARSFRFAAARGIRGIVAHSDPQPENFSRGWH
ncbi:hypothetical protein [Streptomyces sp. NPDC059262]|uniref:hypothetical protein n=1 Tax=Streptomyces sp. NPDC059262 TaxID=3346797 RepID=UPI0036A568BD